MSKRVSITALVILILIAGIFVAYKFTPASKLIDNVKDNIVSFFSGFAKDTPAATRDNSSNINDVPSIKSNCININLSDNNSTISDNGAEVTDTGILINDSGDYYITGTLSNGQILVNTDTEVHLYLDNVNITCSNGAAIVLLGKKDKTITLIENTDNQLTDASEYTISYDNISNSSTTTPDANSDNLDISSNSSTTINSALFCKNDLTINGSGSLTVNSNYNNGITSKDCLSITDSTINVTAPNNAIKGNETLILSNCSINASSDEDVLKTDSDDETLGNIIISNSNLTLIAGSDCIQASHDITIESGFFNISTNNSSNEQTLEQDNSSNQKQSTNQNLRFSGNDFWNDFFPSDSQENSSQGNSMKGIKADNKIIINNGEFTINTTDDAIHAAGNITINNGSFDITTQNDAIHSDVSLDIMNGTIKANECYEGLEACKVTIYDGNITIYSEDDSINCAEYGVVAQVDVANENCILTVEGGTIHSYVTTATEGDGFDSNGYIYINGGNCFVESSYSGPDSALDADGDIYVTGGYVVATGGAGRGEMPAASSSQCSLFYGSSTTYEAGIKLELFDSNNNSIISYSPLQSYSAIIVSAPEIISGNTYDLEVNNTSAASFTPDSGITTKGSTSSSNGGGGINIWR